MSTEIKIPDIGDFDAVEVIEVLVAVGDEVALEQPLITLESDKATLEVPATTAGTITEMRVSEGDKVSEGDVIGVLQASETEPAVATQGEAADKGAGDADPQPATAPAPKRTRAQAEPTAQHDYDVVVLGAGPGGYTAAFRAADLGLQVALVERHRALGGVCLNVGCIPSKALLHSAKVIEDAAAMAAHGVSFGAPKIDLGELMGFKQSVIDQLTGGLEAMAKKRRVDIITGSGTFVDAHTLAIESDDGAHEITFQNAIVAVGSEPATLPFLPADGRVWDSEAALNPDAIPESLLVIGGGIIGLELANVYAAHGTRVDVVEMTDNLLPGADRDLVKPLQKRMQKRCRDIWTATRITALKANPKYLKATFEGSQAPETRDYDRVLVAVGRKPNGHRIAVENAGVGVSEQGFIHVDHQCRSNITNIFAIGDVSGEPQLAHRASHQGKVAAECCAGEKAAFDVRCIPSVVYTDPEVAWTGVTENQAREDGIEYEKGAFPWAASGRALGMAAAEGTTKILFDPQSGRVIGAGAVGSGAGELIAELGLAIEMGADADDIGLTIHPHPSLSETVGMAAEAQAGTLTDLYMPKNK